MEPSHPGEEVLERLRVVLRAGPALRLAILFGSAAAGRLRAESDIDIAILPVERDLGLRSELDLQASLARAAGREADLVRLDQASTLVRWEVSRSGLLLHASPPSDWARFRAEAASEYLDFAPSFLRAAETFRRVLATAVVRR